MGVALYETGFFSLRKKNKKIIVFAQFELDKRSIIEHNLRSEIERFAFELP